MLSPIAASDEDQERDHDRRRAGTGCRTSGNGDEGDGEDDAEADAVLPDREDRHVGGVARLELAGLAIEQSFALSDPLDDPLAEQALRPEQQEDERDDIGEPALDAAADQRPPVELAELLADADDEAADDGAGDRGEAAEDQHRQRLQRDDLQREGDVGARAPHDAGRQRHDARPRTRRSTQICSSEMPTDSAA